MLILAKKLMRLLTRRQPQLTGPRCRIWLRVLAPSGVPAVKISCR